MSMVKITVISIIVALLSHNTFASSVEEKGLEISKEAKKRDFGWGDSSCNIKMILRNPQGQESTREIEFKTLEQEFDGDKSLTSFVEPRDVKGTSFLSFSHAIGPDDQWLYLPALRRVKRISTHNKSGPFMGSEFAYEDLSSFEIEKYSYRYLGEEKVNGQDSFMVEQYPTDKQSGYNRRVVWWDKAEYRVQKIDFYDRKNALLKTLTYSGYQKYLDQFWRPDKAEMKNHQSGRSTVLHYEDYRFKEGLNESHFNINALKRIR